MHLTIKIELTPAKTCLGKKTGKYNATLYGKEFHGTKEQIEHEVQRYLTSASKLPDMAVVSNGEECNLILDTHDGRIIYKFPTAPGYHTPLNTGISGAMLANCADDSAVHLCRKHSQTTPDTIAPFWLSDKAKMEFEGLQRYWRASV